MSIITTAQAVPSRLFTLYASLASSPSGELRERLEQWSTPPSLRTRGGSEEDGEAATTLFTNTLSEARRLGLVEESDGKLAIPAEARAGAGKKGAGEEQFRDYLLRTLFDPVRAAESQQSGFMLALAWFLTLSPLVPISFAEAPQNRLRAALGEEFRQTEMTSLHRYQNFLYWARYLGFATFFGASEGERRVIPNPMRAIDAALPTLFAETSELPAAEFMAQLAAIYPVFETGSARQQLEKLTGHSPIEAEGKLSPATSIALQRLADAQKIGFLTLADAPPLLLDFGVRTERVTHITMKGS